MSQCQAHQRVAAVDYQLRQDHFNDCGTCCNNGQTGKLTGTGEVGHGDQNGMPNAEPLGHSHGTEAEADGKISDAHRHTGLHTLCIFFQNQEMLIFFR